MVSDREACRLAAVGKAQQMWDGFTDNEKIGVRFGMFPAAKMRAATQEGYDSRFLTVALMDCASRNGGMRASTTNKPTIGDDTPSHAGARVIVKRALRSMSINPATMTAEELAKFFVANPWACSKQIDHAFHRAAKAWEDGNNSGNQAGLDYGEKLCGRERGHAEALLALLGVKCDYPGLYPTFEYHGHTYYDLDGLWSAIREERKE